MDKNQRAFLDFVKTGLWNREILLLPSEGVDFFQVYKLAQEQSIIGIALAGLEYSSVKPPQELLLEWIGEVQMLEQQNKAMNAFIEKLIGELRKADVYALLVKGQGIAQCYEKPLWRSCGDVDFLLSANNYPKAVDYLKPLASKKDEEDIRNRHYAMTIDSWVVELHGTLHAGLWSRMDKVIDEVQCKVFFEGVVRPWQNGSTQVFLPRADEDVVFVFSHILQHFFKEGIGLRQICDWCRLLWTWKGTIDKKLLESRLRRMGVMTEWHSFAYLAVNTLGMPVEAMPLYSPQLKWERKAGKVLDFIFETGYFGHNRNYSYYNKYPICNI